MSISSFFLAGSAFFSGAGSGVAGAGLVCASDGAAPSATTANTTAISTATSLVIDGLLASGRTTIQRRFWLYHRISMICLTSSKAGRVSGTVHESHRQGRRPIFVLRYAK